MLSSNLFFKCAWVAHTRTHIFIQRNIVKYICLNTSLVNLNFISKQFSYFPLICQIGSDMSIEMIIEIL